jgi:hypothetical protein
MTLTQGQVAQLTRAQEALEAQDFPAAIAAFREVWACHPADPGVAQLLAKAHGTEVVAWVSRIHTIEAAVDPLTVSQEAVEANIVRCPDGAVAERMIERIEAIGRDGDSCGFSVDSAQGHGGYVDPVVGGESHGGRGVRPSSD